MLAPCPRTFEPSRLSSLPFRAASRRVGAAARTRPTARTIYNCRHAAADRPPATPPPSCRSPCTPCRLRLSPTRDDEPLGQYGAARPTQPPLAVVSCQLPPKHPKPHHWQRSTALASASEPPLTYQNTLAARPLSVGPRRRLPPHPGRWVGRRDRAISDTVSPTYEETSQNLCGLSISGLLPLDLYLAQCDTY